MAQNNLKEIKTAKITGKGQISIPGVVRALEGFKEGSKISILVYPDRVELRPLNQINEKLSPELVSEEVLSKEWDNKKEDDAWKNL